MRIVAVFFLIGIIALVLGCGWFVEPERIQVKTVSLPETVLNKALKGKTIVHISDLHLSQFGKKEKELLVLLEKLQPDLIFLTGDYIQWGGDITPAVTFLSQLKAATGVFAVMGDYDYSDSRQSCLFCHEKGTGSPTRQHQVTMLKNSSVKLNSNGIPVEISGLDVQNNDEEAIISSFSSTDQNMIRLVLGHSPLQFDALSDKENILMFSGDTHGGQIRLPLWLFKLFGYEKNIRYNYGLFQEGKKQMYVTRGIGTSHFKFRLFCPPEIAVFKF